MGTPATVCVDNDLAASQTSITLNQVNEISDHGMMGMIAPSHLWATNDEAARGVHVVDGVVVKVLGRDDCLHTYMRQHIS